MTVAERILIDQLANAERCLRRLVEEETNPERLRTLRLEVPKLREQRQRLEAALS